MSKQASERTLKGWETRRANEAKAAEVMERYQRMQNFVRWMGADPAIMSIARNVCRERGIANVGVLARDMPEVFDEMYEAAVDLMDQIPAQEQPGWMR